jgi:hypothetical protein
MTRGRSHQGSGAPDGSPTLTVAPYAGTPTPPQPDETGTAIPIPVTNPLERLNKEVKRRADVVGIFPSEAAVVRLVGAVLLEQNDERQLQHRHVRAEGMAECSARPPRQKRCGFHPRPPDPWPPQLRPEIPPP